MTRHGRRDCTSEPQAAVAVTSPARAGRRHVRTEIPERENFQSRGERVPGSTARNPWEKAPTSDRGRRGGVVQGLSREKTCRLRKEPDSPPMRLSGAAGLRRGGAGALVSARPSGWAAAGPLLQGWLEAPLLKADWPSTGRVDTHCTALPVPALAGAAQHQRPGTGRDARWPRPMAGALPQPLGRCVLPRGG